MINSDKIYKDILNASIAEINGRIGELEKKNKGIYALVRNVDVEIESLKIECERLKKQLEEFENRTINRVELSEVGEIALDIFDEKHENNINKQEEIRKSIEQLEDLKKNLQTSKAKRKIDKKIEQKRKIIQKLQQKSVKIGNHQRKMLLPKAKKEQKRAQLMSKQQAKINIENAKINDNYELQAMLDPENSVIDSMKSVIYDIKGAYYQKRLQHQQDVLKTMKKSNSTIILRGANAITISKKAANKFRQMKDAIIDMVDENNNSMTPTGTPVR